MQPKYHIDYIVEWRDDKSKHSYKCDFTSKTLAEEYIKDHNLTEKKDHVHIRINKIIIRNKDKTICEFEDIKENDYYIDITKIKINEKTEEKFIYTILYVYTYRLKVLSAVYNVMTNKLKIEDLDDETFLEYITPNIDTSILNKCYDEKNENEFFAKFFEKIIEDLINREII